MEKELNQLSHQNAPTTLFLKYKTLVDLLKIIIYSSQSPLGAVPMLYHVDYKGQQILFIQTPGVATTSIHYYTQKDKPAKKFIELKRLTGDFSYVEKIGSDSMSLYLPILELEMTTLNFP